MVHALLSQVKKVLPWALLAALLGVWADPQCQYTFLQLALGGSAGVLVLQSVRYLLSSTCNTPWQGARFLAVLTYTVVKTLTHYVLRGCRPKFPKWTLQFEVWNAVMRAGTAEAGERIFGDAELGKVGVRQSELLGTVCGWVTCRQTGRYYEPMVANGMEHIWIKSSAPRKLGARRMVLFYVHGGGFVAMSPRFYMLFGTTLAAAAEKKLNEATGGSDAQVDIFLCNYRKAPEHRYPAQPNDVMATYEHLLEHEGLSPEQIILAGDSAGGGIVMSTLLRTRENHQRLPLAAMVLCPVVDLSGGEPDVPNCFLSKGVIAALPKTYHPTPEDPKTWRDASAVHCDLTGLPPVLVQTASLDFIHPQALRLFAKAKEDGVDDWELEVHEGVPHVFPMFPLWALPYSQVGFDRMGEFAAQHFTSKVAAGRSASTASTCSMSSTSSEDLELDLPLDHIVMRGPAAFAA